MDGLGAGFLFGNVDEHGRLESDVFNDDEKKQLRGLSSMGVTWVLSLFLANFRRTWRYYLFLVVNYFFITYIIITLSYKIILTNKKPNLFIFPVFTRRVFDVFYKQRLILLFFSIILKYNVKVYVGMFIN